MAQDACYHQACDDYSNPNGTVLTINAKVCSPRVLLLTPLHVANTDQAAAHVLATLALNGHNLIAKNITGDARIQDAGAFVWSTPGEDERHVGMCGQDT